MKYRDIILTASANMWRSKLRTTLTVLALFIGAFTLTLTTGLGAGITNYVDRQVSNMGQKDVIMITTKIKNTGLGGTEELEKYQPGKITSSAITVSGGPPTRGAVLLGADDIKTLEQDKNLTAVTPALSVNPDYIEGKNGEKYKLIASMIGSNAHLDLATGSQLDNTTDQAQIVLPDMYVDGLGFGDANTTVSQTVTIAVTDATGAMHTMSATIVGIAQKGVVSTNGAMLNPALKRQLYNLQSIGLPLASKDKYQSVTAKMTGTMTDARIAEIKRELTDKGYTGQTVDDRLGAFKTVLSVITFTLSGFAIIALLAASFGIVNTLLMSVQERTREIGLMKAMGMPARRIFALFSFEAVLIGLWGSVLGVVVAIGAGSIINRVASRGFLKDLPGFNLLMFPLGSLGLIVLGIVAIAFIASTMPARRASRQNPIDALRYE